MFPSHQPPRSSFERSYHYWLKLNWILTVDGSVEIIDDLKLYRQSECHTSNR